MNVCHPQGVIIQDFKQTNSLVCRFTLWYCPDEVSLSRVLSTVRMKENGKHKLGKIAGMCGFLVCLFLFASCGKENGFDYPIVYTGDVKSITDSSALLTARIENPGDRRILSSGFIWSLTSKDDGGMVLLNPGEVPGTFSLPVNKKLLPAKTYYVRAFAQTENARVYGKEVTFSSLPKGAFNPGKWTRLVNDNPGYAFEAIQSSFTIRDSIYFITYDGYFLRYDPVKKQIAQILHTDFLYFVEFTVVYEDKAYFFYENSFYRFDPLDFSITKRSSPPSMVLHNCTGFSLGDSIFVGLGSASWPELSNEFWMYRISTNSWKACARFPGHGRLDAFAFEVAGKGYIGCGYELTNNSFSYFNDLWEYNPASDSWRIRKELPVKPENLEFSGSGANGFGYFFYNGGFYEYNPEFNYWETMSGVSFGFNNNPQRLFTSNNTLYLAIISGYESFWHLMLWRYEK